MIRTAVSRRTLPGSFVIGADVKTYLPLGLLGVSLSVMHLHSASTLGILFTYLTLLVMATALGYMLISRGFALPRPLVVMSAPWLLLIVQYVASEIVQPTGAGAKTIAQLILAFLFFLACCCIRWDNGFLQRLALVTSLYLIAYIVLWRKTHFLEYSDQGEYDNYNPCGFMLYCVMVFQVFALMSVKSRGWRAYHIFIIVVGLAVHPFCGARSVSLEIVTALALYAAWPLITRSRALFSGAMAFLLAVVVGFILVYTYLGAHKSHYMELETQTRTSGGNFFSGRELVWNKIQEDLRRKPFFGDGAGAKFQDISNMNISASSLYMQVALQAGIPAAILILASLWSIWQCFWLGRTSRWGRVGAAVLYGIIFHQTLEICLTQNQLYVGIFMWMTVAIPLSRVLQEARERQGALAEGSAAPAGTLLVAAQLGPMGWETV